MWEGKPLVFADDATVATMTNDIKSKFTFRDSWAIGGALGFLVDGDVYIHPMEWIDFALGFFLIDIKNDDLVFDDFR